MYAVGEWKDKVQLQDKFAQGIFVGFTDKTTERVVATPDGCVKTNDIKRLGSEGDGDGPLFNAVRGQPWRLRPSLVGGDAPAMPDEPPLRAAIPVPQVPEDVRIPGVRQVGPRRVYIRKAVELARYGYTSGSVGCDAAHE